MRTAKTDELWVYLDDERPCPPGFVACRWPNEVVALLQTGRVTRLSLDHDLGDDQRGTGYDVLLFIEEAVVTRGFIPPHEILIHSANASAAQKMRAAAETIRRLAASTPDPPDDECS